MCGAAGVAQETEDGVNHLSEEIMFTYKKFKHYTFPGGLKLQMTILFFSLFHVTVSQWSAHVAAFPQAFLRITFLDKFNNAGTAQAA